MIKISAKIISKILSSKRLSSFVTYLFIKELHSGKLFEIDLCVLAKERGLSLSTIKEHIQQLLEFGLLEDRGSYAQKGHGWLFVIGNERYNIENDLIGRACVIFDEKFDKRLFYFNSIITKKEKLESFKDLKKLRTYLHIALQQIVTTRYLKPTLTHAEEAEKAEKLEKKKEKARLKRLKKKNKEESILVDQPSVSEQITIEKKTVPTKTRTLTYSVSSSYLTKSLGTYQKGFSASTIRKQQNKAVKRDFLDKARSFNILACTDDFMEYHLENFYKHNLDFSDTVITTQKGIAELYDISVRPNDTYSPLFLWVNRGDSKVGEIDALVQEVSPKLSFGCSIGKFSKRRKKNINYENFEKIEYTQKINPKLTVEKLTACPKLDNESLSIFDLI
jgi:hypothetical protein